MGGKDVLLRILLHHASDANIRANVLTRRAIVHAVNVPARKHGERKFRRYKLAVLRERDPIAIECECVHAGVLLQQCEAVRRCTPDTLPQQYRIRS